MAIITSDTLNIHSQNDRQILTLTWFSLLQDHSSPPLDLDMVEAATTVQAAMVVMVVMVVQLSPSPQSQQSVHLPGEAIKKESQPSSPLETLKFDLNLDPFMVLCKIVKSVKEESRIYPKHLFTKI